MLEHRTFQYELRDMNEATGRMIGYTAVFDVVDKNYNEVFERGAYTKTLNDRGDKRRLLADHKEWIGHVVGAEQDRNGLLIEMEVLKNDVQRASEYWALSKHAKDIGMPVGLSQGFRAAKEKFDKALRRISEVNWIESSITPFQSMEPALVHDMRSLGIYSIAELEQALAQKRAAASTEPDALHSIAEALDRALTNLRAA